MSSVSTVRNGGAIGAGRDRALGSELRRGGDGIGTREVAEDLIDLAGDLRDRSAHGVGAIAVLDMHDAAHARQLVGDEEGAAADRDGRTSPASVFMRSTLSSTMRAASASTRLA